MLRIPLRKGLIMPYTERHDQQSDLREVKRLASERLRKLRDGEVRSASTVFERDGDHFSVRTIRHEDSEESKQ